MTGRLLSTARTTTRALASRRARGVLVALALPVLVVCAYFAGLAGADARTQAIPALVVNNDEMVMQTAADGTQTPVVAGRLVVSELTGPDARTGFSWGLANEETAQQALENGDAYVVVVIPKDFSASVASLANGTPKAAQVSIMTDRSHDYLSPSVAGALSEALTAQFGTALTEQVAIALVSGVEQTALALHQAADGASGIATGGNQLADGLGQYTAGVSQLADGASQLATGGPALATGVRDYTNGVSQLSGGIGPYTQGVSDLSAGVGPYTQGVSDLAAGLAAMDEGMPSLREGGQGLQEMSQQLSGVGTALSGAADAYRDEIRPDLVAISEAGAGLEAVCGSIEDPAAAEQCRQAMQRISEATGGVDGLIGQLDTAAATADTAEASIAGLGQLGTGIVGVADGVHELSTGAAQLAAGGPALADGAAQLAAGGPALADGAAQLAAGGPVLADGVDQYVGGVGQVSTGADQLVAGGPQLQTGAAQLADGATQLSDGLREGADEASSSVGDPDAFANVMAHPVEAVVDARHDPGFGGIVVAVLIPVGVWLAALGTMLARRLLPPGALASSASTGRLVRLAVRRASVPVVIAVVVLALAAHTWLGVPWTALGGTLLLGVLMAVACVGLHVLLTALWGRRLGALASIALLAVQLLAVRGFVPLELLSPFVSAISGVFPASYATSGLQLVYAGGSGGAVLSSAIGLVLIAALSFGALALVLAAKRRTSVAALLPAGGASAAWGRARASGSARMPGLGASSS